MFDFISCASAALKSFLFIPVRKRLGEQQSRFFCFVLFFQNKRGGIVCCVYWQVKAVRHSQDRGCSFTHWVNITPHSNTQIPGFFVCLFNKTHDNTLPCEWSRTSPTKKHQILNYLNEVIVMQDYKKRFKLKM